MNDDLTDAGLNALDALEAQDESSENTTQDEDTSSGDNTEDMGDKTETNEGGEDEKTSETDDAGEDSEEQSEESEETSDEEDKKEDSEPEKKQELSDEEFEELAKKRGYAKAKSEEETKAENEQKTTMEKLLSRPKEVSEEVWSEMDDTSKVIYNALPYMVAEGKNGVVQVKTPEQLPEDFEFKNDKAHVKFENDLTAQENRANQFKRAIEQREQRNQQMAYQRQEAQKVISEIDQLQKSGDLPTPKAKQGTKEFDNDPAVLLINKVLNYRSQRASEGVRLSIRDSLLLYKAENPGDFKPPVAKGDAERQKLAKRISTGTKSNSEAVNKDKDDKPRYYKTGMSLEEVRDAIINDMD